MPPRLVYSAMQLHEMWARGDSREEIAAALGCSTSHVQELARRHKLPRRQRAVQEIFAGDPTPQEIEAWMAQMREKHLAEMRAIG